MLILLQSCAVLADRRVAAGCQVADGVTTYYALTHGAVEGNGLLSAFSPGGILIFKLAFAYFVYKVLPEDPKTTPQKVASSAVTLIGCIPAAHNIQIIRALK